MQNKPYVILSCLLFLPFFLKSQFLVADINKSVVGSNPSLVRAGANHLVFAATNEKYGRELFINIGKVSNPQLVRDFNPGTASTDFWDIGIIDSACYFVTGIGASALQFWRLNFKDLNPVLLISLPVNGIAGGQNGRFIKFMDQVYFLYRNANYRMELWKTKGSPENTSKVFEFGQNVFPTKISVFNNQLVFLAEDNAGRNQLWKSDGTANGTSIIKAVDTQYGLGGYVIFKNQLYFVANDGLSGWEIWQSDATTQGTQLFIDLIPGNGSSFPNELTVVGDRLYFSATNPATGNELWYSEGTPQSTQLLKDIRSGSQGSSPYFFRSANNTLFFLANTPTTGIELWKSDGTADGTQLVKDIFVGPKSSFNNVAFQTTHNDSYFFFVANDSIQGKGLWRTDGTAAGTLRIKDIVLAANASGPIELLSYQHEIYFVTQDGVNGLELWKTDGNSNGTQIFTKLNKQGAGSSPNRLTILKNQLLFSAKTEAEGFELWKFDGKTAQLVKDIFPGSGSSNYALNLIYKDQVFFTAEDKAQNRQIWKSDGTPEGTVVLKRINENSGGSSTEGMAVLKDKLIFNAYQSTEGEELWISDGTEAGTQLLKDINPTGQSFPFIPYPPAILGDSLLFFMANDGFTGTELWKTNGTAQGTSLVANIQPDGNPNSFNYPISILTKVGDRLFFSADNIVNGPELWITDGTSPGTRLVKDIAPGLIGSNPIRGIAFKGQIFFSANDGFTGVELWKSDGTSDGTVLVKDIAPGRASAYPLGLLIHQDELYFVVNEAGDEGNGLWKTDGTSEGTVRVKQIASDSVLSAIRDPFVFGAYLYFSANDGIHGHELWRSDGTEAGTSMIADLNPGSASSEPENFNAYNKDLYFSADDGVHGRELWRLLSGNVVSVDEPHLAEILVFPNPAIDQLVVQRNAESSQLIARLYDANGRTVVQPTRLNEEFTELNVQTLPGGIYFLEVKAAGSLERKVKKIMIVR